MPYLRRALWSAPVLLALLLSVPAGAESTLGDVEGEDYRLFCGYMDALQDPKIEKLKGKARDKKIAKMAKMDVKKLMKSVDKLKSKGATCDEVGKIAETESTKAVKDAVQGRILVYVLDYTDPSHVVASVTWMAMDKKKVVQEAAAIAKVLADSAPITKTIALRAVAPGTKDPNDEASIWFEAKSARARAKNIDPDRIKDFADSRYIRLFDGVRCAAPLAHDTALGYKRGPCEGKTL